MPTTFDRVDLACPDTDPTQWPKLSCGAASQLALHDSSLRLEGDRELLFQDGGQIRSFDHKETSVGLPALAGRGKELTSEGSMPDGVTIIDKLDEPSMGESSFKGRLPPLGGSPVTLLRAISTFRLKRSLIFPCIRGLIP